MGLVGPVPSAQGEDQGSGRLARGPVFRFLGSGVWLLLSGFRDRTT